MREMKDSGNEWIGEIPEDWEIIDNSAYVKMVNEQLAKQNDKN